MTILIRILEYEKFLRTDHEYTLSYFETIGHSKRKSFDDIFVIANELCMIVNLVVRRPLFTD